MTLPEPTIQDRINLLHPEQNDLIIHFQVCSHFNQWELEDLEEVLRRRGGIVTHVRQGHCRLQIPAGLDWVPFFRTLQSCFSVEVTDATTLSLPLTILVGGDDY